MNKKLFLSIALLVGLVSCNSPAASSSVSSSSTSSSSEASSSVESSSSAESSSSSESSVVPGVDAEALFNEVIGNIGINYTFIYEDSYGTLEFTSSVDGVLYPYSEVGYINVDGSYYFYQDGAYVLEDPISSNMYVEYYTFSNNFPYSAFTVAATDSEYPNDVNYTSTNADVIAFVEDLTEYQDGAFDGCTVEISIDSVTSAVSVDVYDAEGYAIIAVVDEIGTTVVPGLADLVEGVPADPIGELDAAVLESVVSEIGLNYTVAYESGAEDLFTENSQFLSWLADEENPEYVGLLVENDAIYYYTLDVEGAVVRGTQLTDEAGAAYTAADFIGFNALALYIYLELIDYTAFTYASETEFIVETTDEYNVAAFAGAMGWDGYATSVVIELTADDELIVTCMYETTPMETAMICDIGTTVNPYVDAYFGVETPALAVDAAFQGQFTVGSVYGETASFTIATGDVITVTADTITIGDVVLTLVRVDPWDPTVEYYFEDATGNQFVFSTSPTEVMIIGTEDYLYVMLTAAVAA